MEQQPTIVPDGLIGRTIGNYGKQALHFYKRFRSLQEQDPAAPLSPKKKDEVERFIAELTECAASTDRSAV